MTPFGLSLRDHKAMHLVKGLEWSSATKEKQLFKDIYICIIRNLQKSTCTWRLSDRSGMHILMIKNDHFMLNTYNLAFSPDRYIDPVFQRVPTRSIQLIGLSCCILSF